MSSTITINANTQSTNVDFEGSLTPTVGVSDIDVMDYTTPDISNIVTTPTTPMKLEIENQPDSIGTPDGSAFIAAMDASASEYQPTARNLDAEFGEYDDEMDCSPTNVDIGAESPKKMLCVDAPEEFNFTSNTCDVDKDLETAIRISLGFKNDDVDESEYSNVPDNLIINDSVLGEMKLANCDWGHKDGKIYNPRMYRDDRRRLRKPLTEQVDIHCLYRFIMSLLDTAFNMELEMANDSEEKYYIFKPYNKQVNDYVDSFSKRSYDREIGIKTCLNKEAANVILTCYYVLDMKFKQTTDEIIFEDIYRECVLMQDSNFDLAKFFDRITKGENLNSFEALRSIMAECLSLVPMPHDQRVLQFNAWTICYSKQTTQVTSNKVGKFDNFKSVIDLMTDYDNQWFDAVVNIPDMSMVNTIMDNINTATKTITDAFNTLTPDLHIEMVSTPLPETNIDTVDIDTKEQLPFFTSSISIETNTNKNDSYTPVMTCELDREIHSVAATPVKNKRNKSDIVDSLIRGFTNFLFTPAKKSEKVKKN